jgi:hypothetical protein
MSALTAGQRERRSSHWGLIALIVVCIGIGVVLVAWFTSSASDWGLDANRSFSTPGSGTYQLSPGTYTLWRAGSTHVSANDVTVRNVSDGRTIAVVPTSGILDFASGVGNAGDILGQVTVPTAGPWRFTETRALGENIALGPSESSLVWLVIGALVIAVGVLAAIVVGIVALARRA